MLDKDLSYNNLYCITIIDKYKQTFKHNKQLKLTNNLLQIENDNLKKENIRLIDEINNSYYMSFIY